MNKEEKNARFLRLLNELLFIHNPHDEYIRNAVVKSIKGLLINNSLQDIENVLIEKRKIAEKTSKYRAFIVV